MISELSGIYSFSGPLSPIANASAAAPILFRLPILPNTKLCFCESVLIKLMVTFCPAFTVNDVTSKRIASGTVVIVTTSSADVDLDVVNPATCEEDADNPAVEHIIGSETFVELFKGSLRQA